MVADVLVPAVATALPEGTNSMCFIPWSSCRSCFFRSFARSFWWPFVFFVNGFFEEGLAARELLQAGLTLLSG